MRLYTFFAFCLITTISFAQQNINSVLLPQQQEIPGYLQYRSSVVTTNPPSVSVRTAAQWEEMQGVVITWNNYDSGLYPLLAEIIDYAQDVATVFIVCDDSNSVINYLNANGVTPTNVSFHDIPSNSIWARDFGPNNIYENEVSNLSFVDWKYNRTNRAKDDSVPRNFGQSIGLNVYSTLASPNRLVHTGGNFMSDGHGTAFSSNLVLDENGAGGGWSLNLTEAQIDSIMKHYMGIKRYIKMETLPYDGIHHIDMHMKLLDEETLLVGEYPTGVADGPQIEQNIQYVTTNFLNCYDRPYKVIRIPQPPSQSGVYPDDGGYYRTYTNALILNNLILVPGYYTQYDTTAQRIWEESMPGYNVHLLDCNDIISYSGAIHCITHEIGVSDPVFISHAKLLDTYQTTGTYTVDAYINTTSGVSDATLNWTIDTTTGYSSVVMTAVGDGNYQALIPAQVEGTKVFYYIEANSNSGRTVRKPLVAPAGVYMFKVLENVGVAKTKDSFEFFQPYPIPAIDKLNVSFYLKASTNVQLTLTDVTGRTLQNISLDNLDRGIHQYNYNVSNLAIGNYFIRMTDSRGNVAVRQISKI